MSVIYRCDGCNKNLNLKNRTRMSFGYSGLLSESLQKKLINKVIHDYDLCDECLEKILTFIRVI